MTKKKGRRESRNGEERIGERVCIIYITVLKGKFKGLVFFSSFDMTLKRF